MKAIFDGLGISIDNEIITYCNGGGASSHAWFVLTQLMGYPNVREYDRSWWEWGNLEDTLARARSGDWIQTSYSSMNDSSSFYDIDVEIEISENLIHLLLPALVIPSIIGLVVRKTRSE